MKPKATFRIRSSRIRLNHQSFAVKQDTSNCKIPITFLALTTTRKITRRNSHPHHYCIYSLITKISLKLRARYKCVATKSFTPIMSRLTSSRRCCPFKYFLPSLFPSFIRGCVHKAQDELPILRELNF